MEFFNNTYNDNLKFKLNSEGIDTNKIESRLILTTSENKNYFFIGKVKNEICEFEIPELELYEKGDTGKIKFEIISEELYFPVWEDEFKIVTKASIKIEEMIISESTKQPVKPKISTSIIQEKTQKPENVEVKKEVIKESVVEEVKEVKEVKKDKGHQDGTLKRFSSFLNEK